MKRKRLYIKHFLLFLLIILTSACETDVNYVDLPEFKQRLVLNSFISPSDTMSYFYISTNKKLYGELNSEEQLGKLTGFISDGVHEVLLDTAAKGLKFSYRDLQVKYGTTYKVRVTSESGLAAEGSCTVPVKRDFEIKLDTFSVLRQAPVEMQAQYGTTYRYLSLKITFQDVPDEENFYRIACSGIVYNSNPVTHNSYEMEISPTFDRELITDKGLDGQRIAAVTTGNNGYYFSKSRDSTLLKIFLYHTEKSYFLYHKSLDDYNDGGNPFSEATPVYSNVTGGLGIFTSYTIDSLIVKIK